MRGGASTRGTRRILFGVALALFFLLFVHPDPDHPSVGRVLALAVWMSWYWLTEALPMAVTAMLPVVFLPAAGVMSAGEVAPLYLNDIIFLFLGGFLLAGAMERWGLHRRLAVTVVARAGRSPGRLLLGFMLASWALSGWISNTATTLMMVPIAMAVADNDRSAGDGFSAALLLGVAYSASIGGMATLIGTPPNLGFARIYVESFPLRPEIGFVQWMLFALPVSILLFVCTAGWLRWRVMGHVAVPFRGALRRDLAEGGRFTREEVVVATAFLLFALLLVTRADLRLGDHWITGWASGLGWGRRVGDGTVAIGVALLLFAIPARGEKRILDAGALGRLPWDVVLLLGGGFALARAFQVSGLSAYAGERLALLEGAPPVLLILGTCVLLTFLTELTSNTATTQIVLPILAALSTATGLNPLLLMVLASLSASCAFMLPVATPPNAIVFGTGQVGAREMMRTGFVLNLLGVVVITASMLVWGRTVFGI